MHDFINIYELPVFLQAYTFKLNISVSLESSREISIENCALKHLPLEGEESD
jgi:hypothetical protein